MKNLLFCCITSQFESEIFEKLQTLIKVRLDCFDIRKIMLSDNTTKIISACTAAINEGYSRIVIHASTLVYSPEFYFNLRLEVGSLQKANQHVSLSIFSPDVLIDACADEIERNVYLESLPDLSFRETRPEEIQMKSFDLIARRIGSKYENPEIKAVVVRVIHAVADFNIERFMHFSPDAVTNAKKAITNGNPIITDVSMVSSGLSSRFNNITICSIAQPGVAEFAIENNITRSAAAMELLKERIDGSVIAIGNAPTALVQLLSIVNSSDIRPACVIGVPVGFIGAAESKEMLMSSGIPYISTRGNRGGSSIAVAIINAIGCL